MRGKGIDFTDDEWDVIESVLRYGEYRNGRGRWQTGNSLRRELADRIRCRDATP